MCVDGTHPGNLANLKKPLATTLAWDALLHSYTMMNHPEGDTIWIFRFFFHFNEDSLKFSTVYLLQDDYIYLHLLIAPGCTRSRTGCDDASRSSTTWAKFFNDPSAGSI